MTTMSDPLGVKWPVTTDGDVSDVELFEGNIYVGDEPRYTPREALKLAIAAVNAAAPCLGEKDKADLMRVAKSWSSGLFVAILDELPGDED
jgi:hypothetical protein